jgi:hypothetical protein
MRMKRVRTAALASVVIGSLAGSVGLYAAVAATSAAEQTAAAPAPAPREAVQWAVGPASSIPTGQVQPAAVEALARMSRYLQSLSSAEIVAQGSLDVVNVEGQKIQIDGTTTIEMKHRGFVIHHANDLRSRDFYYDGSRFTMVAPKLNFYATVPAPPTNHEVLQSVYSNYGISLPLEDFFQWASVGAPGADQFLSAFSMGASLQDGVKTTHYAFRDAKLDWEIWIKDGAQPLPLKLSIVDRMSPARPAFTARLAWKLNPEIPDTKFTFKPTSDSKRIDMSEAKGPIQ